MKKKMIVFLVLMLASLMIACGDNSQNFDVSEIKQNFENGIISLDYYDSISFEQALNEGEKVVGQIVQFDVIDYKPDSKLGIDCWSGEHLNFISEYEPSVIVGDFVVAYIKGEPSKVLGSWKIPYEVLEINKEPIMHEIGSEEVVPEHEVLGLNDDIEENELQVETREMVELPLYDVIDMNETMYVKIKSAVKDTPEADGEEIGTLEIDERVEVTGKVNNGWYRIKYNDKEVFVKEDVLLTQKEVDEIRDEEEKVKAAEEKRKAEEQAKAAEEKRIAEEKAKAAEEKRKAEEQAKAAEEKRMAEEQAKAAEEKRIAEEQAKATEEKRRAEEQNVAPPTTSGGRTVYIAPDSGEKYHYNPKCRGLKKANSVIAVTIDEAIAQGKSLCGYED